MSLGAKILVAICIAACLASVSHAIAGQATFYTPPYVPSACYGYTDEGVMIAAANVGLFANGGACGRNYRVTCTSGTNLGVPHPCRGSVTVKIVDKCPGCNGDQLDLSQEAFAVIADPNAGRINIDYVQV